MPRKMTYACAICGIEKKESNHWFVHLHTKIGFYLGTWEWAKSEDQLDADGVDYICGHRCAHALLDQFLSAQRESKQ